MEFMTGVAKKEYMEIHEILSCNREGQEIRVRGAIHTIRDMGDVAFIVLRQREGLVQCVYESGTSAFDLSLLKEADTVEVQGTVKADDRSPNGFELILKDVIILSEPAAARSENR